MMRERANEKETRPRTSNPRLRSDRIRSNSIEIPQDPIGNDRDFIGSHRILLFFVGIWVTDSHRIYTEKNPWDPTDGFRRFPSAGNYRIPLLHPTESTSRIKNFRFLVRIRISFGFLQESKSTKIVSFILRKNSFRFSEIKNPKLHFSYPYEDFVSDFSLFKI